MIRKDRHHNNLSNIIDYLISKGWIYIVLIFALYQFYLSVITRSIYTSMAFAILPFAIFIFLNISIYVEKAIYALFISQFILLIAAGFFDFPLGIYNLVFSLFIISLLIIYHIYKKPYWKNSYNGMLLLYSIWALFCVLELGNPNNVQAAWNISITHYAFYPILCALLVPMAIKKPKDMEWLFIIWSIFILIVAAKGYWQKNHGFNEHEYYFLYDLGGAKTHLIWSGIRYFSYFPDAANFGVHMAMGTTAFSIAIFYVKNIWLKFYYIIVVAAAIYGMGISGTRAAMAVPFGGLALFIILSKNKSGFIIGTIAMISLFFFFRFTAIGDGNQYIRKMRSAFYAEQDASYQVRMVNREKMKVLMASKPFGYGIGLGGKAERFHPKELMPYPPDSWLVNVWTDTGIVGLSLYLLVNVALFAWCCWILLFKIKDKRLKGLLTAWLCMNAGYFVSAFANDVMQYPNSIVVYVGFALCFAGTHIDKAIEDDKEMSEITVK